MAKPVTLAQIKHLRATAGVGIMEAKKALTQAGGNEAKAKQLLRAWGAEALAGRQDKPVAAGRIFAYVHPGGQIGAMVAVNTETDFVANSAECESLCRELCLQIAAMDPKDPETLLSQEYIRDPKKTIADLVTEYSVRFKEKVVIRALARLAVA